MIAAATLAAADGKPNELQKRKAGELVREAIAKSQAGEHDAAIEKYQAAYDTAPSPLLLSNIGAEYEKAGKKVEAVKFFCKYLDQDPNGNNADYASAQVRALQADLGNQVEDKDPCTIKKPTPVAPPPVGTAPEPKETASATGTAKLEEAPAPGRGLRIGGIGVGAAGIAAFGVGVYFGVKAQQISKSITHHDPTQPWPTNINQQESTGKSDQARQIGLMVGGGVLVGAGAVMYWMGMQEGKSAAKSEHAVIVPVAAPGLAGIAVSGGF